MSSIAYELPFNDIDDSEFQNLLSNGEKLPLSLLDTMTLETFTHNDDINTRDYDPDNFYLHSMGYQKPQRNYLFPGF